MICGAFTSSQPELPFITEYHVKTTVIDTANSSVSGAKNGSNNK